MPTVGIDEKKLCLFSIKLKCIFNNITRSLIKNLSQPSQAFDEEIKDLTNFYDDSQQKIPFLFQTNLAGFVFYIFGILFSPAMHWDVFRAADSVEMFIGIKGRSNSIRNL
jgi:hypothetical protein